MHRLFQVGKGTHVKVLEDIKKQGFVRVSVDGEMLDLSEEIELKKNKKHSIEVIIDRIVVKAGGETRLADSLKQPSACVMAKSLLM